MTLLDDPIEQWLLWEEQANLHGFRTSTEPVPIEVAAVPRESGHGAHRDLAAGRDPRALRPPRPRAVPAPSAEPRPLGQVLGRCRPPSAGSAATPRRARWSWCEPRERALFSLKLATDRPHPDFHQPEKTRMREEVNDALVWVDLIARVDGMLGADPHLHVVKEVFGVLVPRSETAYLVRDLRAFQDGHYYLPALSIPWVGRQIARARDERFEGFWGRHYAEAVGPRQGALLRALRPPVRDAESAERAGAARRAAAPDRRDRAARPRRRQLRHRRAQLLRVAVDGAAPRPPARDEELLLGLRRGRARTASTAPRSRTGTRDTIARTSRSSRRASRSRRPSPAARTCSRTGARPCAAPRASAPCARASRRCCTARCSRRVEPR